MNPQKVCVNDCFSKIRSHYHTVCVNHSTVTHQHMQAVNQLAKISTQHVIVKLYLLRSSS